LNPKSKTYNVLSTKPTFIDHWTAEDLEGGDDEYVSWAGEIQIKHKLINALQKLETIEYVF
jgi:hypothetical protein